MFHGDDYLAEQDEATKRSRRMPRNMVHIHVLRDYGYLVKAREHAELIGLAVDWWAEGNIHILAIAGTLNQICLVQSFIDGMNAI